MEGRKGKKKIQIKREERERGKTVLRKGDEEKGRERKGRGN